VRSLRQKAGAHQGSVQRPVGAAVAALVGVVGVLDLDHVGAEHRKLIGRERPRQHMRDVDDADTLERAGHSVLSGLALHSAEIASSLALLATTTSYCHCERSEAISLEF